MSNDRYEKIRKALAMGPTPGPWIVTHELRKCDETVCDLVNGTWIVTAPGVKLAHWEYDAVHIAACDPDTIRALLEERDALQAENERLRNGLDRVIEFERDKAPFTCKYCGRPSWIDPSDQLPPPDYCHEIDHGT